MIEKQILVVCRDYQEYIEWCRENHRTTYNHLNRYIRSPFDFMGTDPDRNQLVFHDRWYLAPNIDDIIESAEIHGFIIYRNSVEIEVRN